MTTKTSSLFELIEKVNVINNIELRLKEKEHFLKNRDNKKVNSAFSQYLQGLPIYLSLRIPIESLEAINIDIVNPVLKLFQF
jgi:hypothetical protein